MEKKAYTILETTPRLGRAGDTVELPERAAKYWLKGGVIADAKKAAVEPKTTSKGKGKKG